MKKTVSLRTRMLVIMALLVVLQSLAMASSNYISGVYDMLDSEAFRLFESSASSRAQTYNLDAEQLVVNMAAQARALSEELNALADQARKSPQEIYRDKDLYIAAAAIGAESVLDILAKNVVSGAFVIFSNAGSREGAAAHSAVYMRNSAPLGNSGDRSHYLLEVGPISVSRAYGISTSINWRLEIEEPDSGFECYEKPILAALSEKNAEVERYGYWSALTDVLGDGQSNVMFTIPLIGKDHTPYGVVGFEISLPLFNRYYLPNADLPYKECYFVIASVVDETVDLSWFIPSSPIAKSYLSQTESFEIKKKTGSDLYVATLPNMGGIYCAVYPLNMYSRNSMFYDETWGLVNIVPQNVLHETSTSVKSALVLSIIVTAAIGLVAVLFLVFTTTHKISGLSKYVRGLSPYMDISFTKTSIAEIDDLTAAVELFSKSVVNASKTTSKMLELTLLPIGGYEISEESGTVILTEYIHSLLQLPPGEPVSKTAWEKLFGELTAEPAEGYDDVYRFRTGGGRRRWLRIKESATENGKVGAIIDVSEDVEENRRLSHKLDYDALTKIYNRTAFKRESYRRIKDCPESLGVMVFADLDNLKYINDTYGHDIGDRLIIKAADLFREFEKYGGVVSRISGDEFAAYLPGFKSKEEALRTVYGQFAENEKVLFTTPDGKSQKIRASAGLAFYPDDSNDVTDLLKLADFAMYEAKNNRKGSIYQFNMEAYKSKAYLLNNREAINRLLDDKLIRFAFQPIVDMKSGAVYAYEALMRPLLENFNSPLEVLAVAEKQSKLGQLENVVITTALQYVKDNAKLFGKAKVFINSVPGQVPSDDEQQDLAEAFADIFDRIVIEITEDHNVPREEMDLKANFVHSNGMQLAIDDFGSGYSNEMLMLSVSPDIVKIDIGLISGIDANIDKQELVASLTTFCHAKGIKLVAEGVETQEELSEVFKLGIDYAQGYYLARPQFEVLPIPDERVKEIRHLNGEG